MHILAFYQYFSTNEVSGSTRPYEIFRRMVQTGDSVTIIAANWVYATGKKEAQQGLFWNRTQADGLDIIRVTIPFGGSRKVVPRIIGFVWFIPFAFLAALSAQKPDVIIASSTPLTIGIPAYLLSRLHRVPFIFELRDLWPDCPVVWGIVKNRLLIRASYWLESFLYRKAAFLVSVTEGIRKELIKKGIPAEGVRTITTACDLALFTPDGAQEDLESLANIPADAFLCIHTGSLGFANSLDFIIDGAERVLDDPSIHFLLVGNGSEKPRLMSEVSRRNLRNVHFLSPVPKAALPRFLRRADLGILCVKPSPLTYIFLQNKFFDYLACGCPVIVNFEGEARDYVEPVNAGIFVPPGDVDALSSAIRNLAADRATARNMRLRARQLAERHFSWDYKAADYRDVISSVLTEDAAADLAR
jgi:glycosyltransferase involved in cell wall biosynthesis